MASKEDSSTLLNGLFTTVTEHFPDVPLGDRTDLVMDLYQVFHKWAVGEHDDEHGVTDNVVEVEIDI